MICKHILLISFLNDPKLVLFHAVKWFHVLLCITNNSINITYLCIHSKMTK